MTQDRAIALMKVLGLGKQAVVWMDGKCRDNYVVVIHAPPGHLLTIDDGEVNRFEDFQLMKIGSPQDQFCFNKLFCEHCPDVQCGVCGR